MTPICHNNNGLGAYLSAAYPSDVRWCCLSCNNQFPVDEIPAGLELTQEGDPECCGMPMQAKARPEPVPVWKRHWGAGEDC